MIVIERDRHRTGTIRNVDDADDAADAALDRRGGEQHTSLATGKAEMGEVNDRFQAGLAIGDRRVHVVLLAVLDAAMAMPSANIHAAPGKAALTAKSLDKAFT